MAYQQQARIDELEADKNELRTRLNLVNGELERCNTAKHALEIQRNWLQTALRRELLDKNAALRDACTVLDLHHHAADCARPVGHCETCERFEAAATRIEQARKR